MLSHAGASSLDVDALDAALDFISHYELASDSEAAHAATATGEAAPVDLTSRFQFYRAHSLDPPVDHELPDISALAAAGDGGLEALFHPIGSVEVSATTPRPETSLVPVTPSTLSTSNASSPPSAGAHGVQRMHSTTSRLIKLARPKKAPPASRRQELAELQDTVKQLTEKLDLLRASSSDSPTAEPLQYMTALMAESDSVWEKLAARQLKARQKAEEENRQLWTTVDQQVRFAKNLKRKLRRHTKDDVGSLSMLRCTFRSDPNAFLLAQEIGRAFWLKRPKPLSADATSEIFRDLERNLDELYVGVDKKLLDAEMHLLPCPGKRRQVKRDAVNELFIELIDSNPVPFGVRKTAKAAWMSMGERALMDRYPQNMLSKVRP